jgi:hypothetical protein
VQPGAFYLLHGGDTEDALQSSAYLTPIVSEGCRQNVLECNRRGHVLAGRGEGKELLLPRLLLHGPTYLQRCLAFEHIDQPGFCGRPLISELTLMSSHGAHRRSSW